MAHVQDEDLMRRFLLGEVDEDERTRVEERFMADADYFEALCALEDEMGALPLLAGFASPFRTLRRRHAHRAQPIDRCAIEKTQFYGSRGAIFRHIFAPPLGKAARSGNQCMYAIGWRCNEDGVPNLGQETSSIWLGSE